MSVSSSMEVPEAVETTDFTTGLDIRKLGMWIFLSSEVIFFGSLIATFLIYKGRSTGIGQEVLAIDITAVNTSILIMSSLTMVLSLEAATKGKKGLTTLWLLLTIILGSIFLGIQGFEYTQLWHEGLTPTSNLFGSAFYTLTGFHGTHVFVGVILLIGLFVKSIFFGGFGSRNYIPVELVGLYWHFVDLVWILIFTLVYLI